MKRSSPDKPRSKRRLRLLLHAVDGCVPYLTPSVLEAHFPPSDDLWIGMAVRDICVVPSYTSKSGKNKNEKNNTVSKEPSKKPRGYTFLGVGPDPWLLPYTRITVPSFDLIQDNEKQKSKAGTSINSSNNNQVLVWTPHGRQKLTPQLYAEASQGLNSQFTLSLYDMNDDNTSKRQEKAEARTKQWFQDIFKRRTETKDSGTLWSPLLLPSAKETFPETFLQAHEGNQQVAGVALIGQWREGFHKPLQSLTATHVAMLSTQSLLDILEIVSTDIIDTIGTELPTVWAKNKLALGIETTSAEAGNKRAKQGESKRPPKLDKDGCMDLSDKTYVRDSRPLVPGCSCLACSDVKFSRAYLHHLICAKELLVEILLFGHNLHHLLVLIRSFNDTENREKLQEFIMSQLDPSPPAESNNYDT